MTFLAAACVAAQCSAAHSEHSGFEFAVGLVLSLLWGGLCVSDEARPSFNTVCWLSRGRSFRFVCGTIGVSCEGCAGAGRGTQAGRGGIVPRCRRHFGVITTGKHGALQRDAHCVVVGRWAVYVFAVLLGVCRLRRVWQSVLSLMLTVVVATTTTT